MASGVQKWKSGQKYKLARTVQVDLTHTVCRGAYNIFERASKSKAEQKDIYSSDLKLISCIPQGNTSPHPIQRHNFMTRKMGKKYFILFTHHGVKCSPTEKQKKGICWLFQVAFAALLHVR